MVSDFTANVGAFRGKCNADNNKNDKDKKLGLNENQKDCLASKEDLSIKEILKAAQSVVDLPTAINAITKISKFLNHPKPEVQKFAAAVVVKVVVQAAEFLTQESDPSKVIKYGLALIKAISEIAEGSVIKSDDSLNKDLSKALNLITEKVSEASSKNEDGFVPFEGVQKNIQKGIQKGLNNLMGGSCDQFIGFKGNNKLN
jgi:hypothetical protein